MILCEGHMHNLEVIYTLQGETAKTGQVVPGAGELPFNE